MMEMPVTLRPGVYTEVQAHPAVSGDYPRFAAAVGAAAEDAPGEARMIHELTDAAAFGAGSVLYGMVAAMLGNGSPVYAVAAQNDYDAALEKLEGLPVAAVACDGGEAALLAHVVQCCAAGKERIGMLAAGVPNEAVMAAGRCNHAHLVIVCDGGEDTARTAAAFAAQAARLGAAGSLNGLAVRSATAGEGTLAAPVVERLLRSGVTPFEQVGGQLCCVRARTSFTSRDGVPDGTFADLSATLAADEVLDAVRRAVRLRLRGLKNNAETRERIATQIVVELEQKRQEGLIDSYQLPVVSASAQDAAVCVAVIRFRIAPEISQIVLQTQIVM